MKAIIPAAGIGTRLQPHTFNRPKVMVPVAGKPILEHIAESLFDSGFDRLCVIVGYKKEAVTDYFNARYPGRFTFPVQEEMKGLAHAVLYGLEDTDEPALIILGDTIIDMDFGRFKDSGENIIAVVKVDDPSRFGIVETDYNSFITAMVEKPEKPKSDLAIAGAYFIKNQKKLKSAIEELMEKEIKTRGEYQLTDALAIMMQKGERFRAMPINDWYDCGKPETLLSTNRFLLRSHGKNHGMCTDCTIYEPVYIGEGSRIENSEIGPNVAIGRGVTVRHSRIVNTMIFRDATVEHSELQDSIIGERARVSHAKGALNTGDEELVSGKG
ncbi:MAG: NTP transferase domain-containing protein [FCB group bacterium]|nr:NTP transferase domain-containing protein [FCB group bacterium]